MSIHRHINPLPSTMEIKKGEGGDIKRFENSFKNADFEQDVICYDNYFITDVIGLSSVKLKSMKHSGYCSLISVPMIPVVGHCPLGYRRRKLLTWT